mmetsp:Transcript_19894/g.28487  ORF Transcript_19894/g.28487 Transcript_19894/m.28487 type:complete len:129 (-) Transcript_19894:2218-2604(-)|eukprot:CAMPEP_0170114396 /NCGR_PEP_ID=MMETSP0020_2-20130122/10669_1 /TAXON_ID=98059 /ORGANISM="Dinobryon sp., Strain UTEXLB2267" /LENGTH=128 /DNA_ID=CAMNT_0010341355 /DNA_START=16 /DNA_END=402 /DNA_ORIENTATION=-
MSWFGGGSKKPEPEKSIPEHFVDESDDFNDSHSLGGNDFASSSLPSGGLLGGSKAPSSFEQALFAEQQKALVQAVVFKLTDISFEQCVPKPSTSLSYSEQSCITSVVGKYLETTDIVVGRLSAANHRG